MKKTDHPTFDDIEHTPLRVLNRVITSTNLTETFGKDEAFKYLSSFTDGERAQIYTMSLFIKQKGLKAASKLATKGLVLA